MLDLDKRDTSGLVTKTVFNYKNIEFENKIPNTIPLVTATILNTKLVN